MIRDTLKNSKTDFQEKVSGYLVAAFGLVAALAWNDAVRSMIDYLFRFDKNAIAAKFLYAFIVTVIFIVISLIINRVFKKKEEGSKA